MHRASLNRPRYTIETEARASRQDVAREGVALGQCARRQACLSDRRGQEFDSRGVDNLKLGTDDDVCLCREETGHREQDYQLPL